MFACLMPLNIAMHTSKQLKVNETIKRYFITLIKTTKHEVKFFNFNYFNETVFNIERFFSQFRL